MPDKAWVRNNTAIPQYWGSHLIPPNGVGTLPMEVALSLKQHPLAELAVLDHESDNWIFKSTDHLPFSPRFRERR